MPSRDEREAAVLVSGGIDSAVLAVELTRRFARIHPLYVRFGLRWEGAELEALGSFLDRSRSSAMAPLTILDEPVSDVYVDHWSLGDHPVPVEDSPDDAVHLPGRNVLLVAKAAVWCGLRRIETMALGTLVSNPFPDGSANYFESMGKALSLALGRRIELIRPFERMLKSEVMKLGASLPIDSTFSCLDPRGGRHCGACNKCGERRRAFRSVGWPDPTSYSNRPAEAHRGISCTE